MDNKERMPYQLNYHIMPPMGWLNDPNGLCYYNEKYHVFFQYSPDNVYGGLKSWGHYISEDLLHWEFLGESIRPDTVWEKDGAYSGCAFVEDERMEIFYTGNVKEEGKHDYIHTGREANILYVSSKDGMNFGKKRLLLTNDNYPKEYTCHVRDPKVWKENNLYYMVLGGRKKGDIGAVLLYSSKDKFNWQYEKEYITEQPFGYMWECPDMFLLDGQRILSVCPQGLLAETFRYENKYQSGYFLCNNEKLSDFIEWDYGFDFYAPQTFCDGKRRILVGWAGVPEMEEEYNNNPTIEEGWQHSLTLMRELKWINGKIYQYPVKEYVQLRGEEIIFHNKKETVPQTYDAEVSFKRNGKDKSIIFGHSLILHYTMGTVELKFLDYSGCGRTVRRGRLDDIHELRIMMDTSMLELYLNGGEMVFTSRWFANTKETNTLEIVGEIEKICMWKLNL